MPRVLLVDDEPQVCELARRALSQLSIEADAAHNGVQALEMFVASPYQAVVTDLRMPHRHGHALAVDLMSAKPNLPVFVLTGLAAPPLVADLLNRGVRGVLQKPFDYRELARRVQDAIGGSASPAAPEPMNPAKMLKSIEQGLQELSELFADQLSGVFEQGGAMADPPSAVGEFIKRFAKQEAEAEQQKGPGIEGRSSHRVPCDAIALAVPVTRHFAPNGEPFRVAIRDVSEGGVRLLHTRATSAKFLALSWRATQLPATELGVVSRVMRCAARSPFYDIGVQFVLSD